MERSHSRHHIHAGGTFGQRAADTIANGMGSWAFIIVQSVLIVLWVVLNVVGIVARWDPYPFILLNLLFSTQAAYAAPIIMMSQNRQAYKDHLRDDFEAEEVELLFKINKQQLEILRLLRSRITPEAPEITEEEAAIRQRAAQLEARAQAVEDELGVHRVDAAPPAPR
jgi:uncharacterized membrane protein